MNIAAFKQEYARRSTMTAFERINEDADRAKARQAAAFAEGGNWWHDATKWHYADASSLQRPTETLAFRGLLHLSGLPTGYALWTHHLRKDWIEARAVVLASVEAREAERRERQKRLRVRRPVTHYAAAL